LVTSGSLTVNGDLTVNGTSLLKAIDNIATINGVNLGITKNVTRIDTKNNSNPGIKNSIYSILFFFIYLL
jgi:hypothetical protein